MRYHFVILGPPGSGKGTQATRLSDRLDVAPIGAGELLRAEVARDSALGREVATHLDAGQLVPLPLLMQVIESAVAALPDNQGVVFDGIPRSLDQARELDALLERHERPLDAVIVLDVPDDVVRERLLARGRPDDTPDVIRERMRVYYNKVPPILERYRCRGLLHRVDGTGTRTEVFDRIIRAVFGDEGPPG